LQSDNLIATRKDLLNRCTLVIIQSELLPFGNSINCRPRIIADDDGKMVSLALGQE